MTAAPTTTTTTDVAAAGADGWPPRLVSDRGRSRPVLLVAGVAGDGASAGVLATRPAGEATVQDLLRQRADLPAGHPGRVMLRQRAIEAGLPLARRLASRYKGRGEPLDDLYQVAALALVKAVDGYDPARPSAFTSYAVATIGGGLKRHFRDTTWRVRVPRRVQEMAMALVPASASLTQQLGRSPTTPELAAHLHSAEEEVAVAVNAWRAYQPESLDALSVSGRDDRLPLIDTIGAVDARLDAVTDRHTLQALLATLPVRQRRILVMRYVGEMTQAEIAAQVGVSQMHVSRLLQRMLTQLRTGMLAD
jgi:RNA polymerase sigma-B factor